MEDSRLFLLLPCNAEVALGTEDAAVSKGLTGLVDFGAARMVDVDFGGKRVASSICRKAFWMSLALVGPFLLESILSLLLLLLFLREILRCSRSSCKF